MGNVKTFMEWYMIARYLKILVDRIKIEKNKSFGKEGHEDIYIESEVVTNE